MEEEGGEVVGVVEDIIKIAGGMDVHQVKTEKGSSFLRRPASLCRRIFRQGGWLWIKAPE